MSHRVRSGSPGRGAFIAGVLLLLAGAAIAAEEVAAPAPTPSAAETASAAEEQQTQPDAPGAQTDETAQSGVGSVQAALEACNGTLDALNARLEAAAQTESQLRAQIDRLRARLPTLEGGSLNPADARRQANEDAASLATAVAQAQGLNNPKLWHKVREAENRLHRSQFLLARAVDARTVYRVRPGDTLAQVSFLFYGDAAQWTNVFDANRHVLDEPDAIPPGLTLVIP